MRKTNSLILPFVASAAVGVAVWAALHFTAPRKRSSYQSTNAPAAFANEIDSDRWAQAVAKVKEDRPATPDTNVALEVPAELRHYEDRHWFLATQVAEVKEYNISNCQDYLDLAAVISRGDLVPVPAVTDDYVLLGVGAKADGSDFVRYQDDRAIPLLDETQLHTEQQRLSDARANAQQEMSPLQNQLSSLKTRHRSKLRELQKQIFTKQEQLESINEEQMLLDQFYGRPEQRQKLFSDYANLQALAKNFRGHSYDLANSSERQALKVAMLSSLRPQALKILEGVASAYHHQFERPLPVSSLVRPEEYQRILRRFNRYAVLIDTPPHSTGLAFDIDYRYMSTGEQNFVMNELARLKQQGHIEVLRERGANFHVFAFIAGIRPSDDLIAASLEEANPSLKEANHASENSPKSKENQTKPAQTKPSGNKSRAKKRR